MAEKNEIAKTESASLQPLEDIENLIHVIRGKQVIIDRDLARLYGVETKRLNQQVQRNLERFPEDFMFQLSKEEVEFLRSQVATSNDISRSQNATLDDDVESLRSQFATSKTYPHLPKTLDRVTQMPAQSGIFYWHVHHFMM